MKFRITCSISFGCIIRQDGPAADCKSAPSGHVVRFHCARPVQFPGTLMVRDCTVNAAYASDRYVGSSPTWGARFCSPTMLYARRGMHSFIYALHVTPGSTPDPTVGWRQMQSYG